MLYILDYGAGNVQSLVNTVTHLGYEYRWVQHPDDFARADKLLFPGVGAFGPALKSLREKGYADALAQYIHSGKPFFGICIGMQCLFESSDEDPQVPGLGIIPGHISAFDNTTKSVPHMGWNGVTTVKRYTKENSADNIQYGIVQGASYYFVHTFRVLWSSGEKCAPPAQGPSKDIQDWTLALTKYGEEAFVSVIQKGNVLATQFHPEKSGRAGLRVLESWLSQSGQVNDDLVRTIGRSDTSESSFEDHDELEADWKSRVQGPMAANGYARRIVACLDVRANDDGDLVVTKGDQYDVREANENDKDEKVSKSSGQVRNLGKPVDLAKRYYLEGADEIAFLNITSFRSCPLHDQPMLDVVRKAAETVYVPLTIGGGIRDTVDPDGTKRSALEVASAYFRSGADKVSIGSDAVYLAEKYVALAESSSTLLRDLKGTGDSGIETISKAYGSQAVVVSVDPKRVYANSLEEIPSHHRQSAIDLSSTTLQSSLISSASLTSSSSTTSLPSIPLSTLLTSQQPQQQQQQNLQPDLGPNGEKFCWYQCTVSGGRETRDIDVVQLVQCSQALGAGEVLLNCVDKDGAKSGFDLRLIHLVRSNVSIPIVASSGAGSPTHFVDVFETTGVEAALAAGIFHRREVPIDSVKEELVKADISVRSDLM